MLLGLLVYAYCGGVRSSRQIERLCTTDVAFRVLCAQDVPDHCTIARFRSDCQDVFEDLFTQVLLIAARSGLARFGTVAIDGTKIPANASIDANRGQQWLEQQVRDMVADAKAVDAVEDTSSGSDDGPEDRMPAGPADQSSRRQRIRAVAQQVPKRWPTAPVSMPSGSKRLWRGGAVQRPGCRWSGGFRTGRIGWLKPRPIWPVRSRCIRPSSTAMPGSWRQERNRWEDHRYR
jgi:hypothetical protein